MTADLDSQLERYTAAVSDHQLPITAAEARELLGMIRELPDPLEGDIRRLPRRMVVAAAAAVMISVLVGGVAWLAQSDGPAPPAQQPTETTIVGSWYRVPELQPFNIFFWDVAQTPVGLLAWDGEAGLWNSHDGISWEPFARESVGSSEFDIASIASSELGTVVIGWHGAAWFSPDGDTWVPIDFPLNPEPAIARVAASPDEFVAIVDGRFWVSANGMDWQEVPSSVGGARSLTATPFGFFALLKGTTWHSPDGLQWTDLADSGPRINGGVGSSQGIVGSDEAIQEAISPLVDIAGSSRGVVAVHSCGGVWFSPNGVEWQKTTLPDFDRCSGGLGLAVGASDTGFLITAADYEEPRIYRQGGFPGAWFSEDGLSWNLVPYQPSDEPVFNEFGDLDNDVNYMHRVVPLGTGFLIIGEAPDSDRSPVWIYER